MKNKSCKYYICCEDQAKCWKCRSYEKNRKDTE